jgi:hypothetical protein
MAQNEVVFRAGFLAALKRHAARFCYMTFGHGDEVQVMTPEAVRRIGLYDERFCNIGFHEADCFLRALIAAPEAVSINDDFHGRVHNPVPNDVTEHVATGYSRRDPAHLASMAASFAYGSEARPYHGISRRVFAHKWAGADPQNWGHAARSLRECAKQYMMYPYFKYHVV